MSLFERIRCWWRGHPNREALGSVMSGLQPSFYYRCRDCGRYFLEPWSEA